MELELSELNDLHLVIIHRERHIEKKILPVLDRKGTEAKKYAAEAGRLRKLAQKICHASLELELGFSLPFPLVK
jgi:hypothetical protein